MPHAITGAGLTCLKFGEGLTRFIVTKRKECYAIGISNNMDGVSLLCRIDRAYA